MKNGKRRNKEIKEYYNILFLNNIRERKATFGKPTVLHSFRFLYPPIVLILVLYNSAIVPIAAICYMGLIIMKFYNNFMYTEIV